LLPEIESPAVEGLQQGRNEVSLAGFPRRFDSYVLLKPLARGGMGQLYLAMTGAPGLEKLCVVKQVPPEIVAPENARRFRDEAMVALRLSHGNLVSVFDAGIHGDRIFLAMEYVDGRDLHAVWNRCAEHRVPFPVEIAVHVVKELCRGLAYAHAFEDLALVHRDVSPGNVMLSFSGEVKLTDFGLATSTLKIEKTVPGIIYGKISYLAPEQARRDRLDGRADLYSAGILLWELLTGRQLFPVGARVPDDSPDAASSDVLARARDPHVIPPSAVSSRVPPELDRIVMRALAPDRADRYPDGEAMRADLAAFLAATAPKTDAARIAEFLRPLFAEDAARDRAERERLIGAAKALLSGVIAKVELPFSATAVSAPAQLPQGLGDVTPTSGPLDFSRPGEDPRVGTTIGGRYHVRRLCGEGAMGRVYEAHHIDIGRRVAIKVLHASFHTAADMVERFRREARAASKIGHANIIDVTDSGTTSDGAFYFVMEYLDGINLEELIVREGALPVERALVIAAQITRALEAAHAADVIHRDLKPANVMLVNRKGEDDFVKVLDFGISKDLDVAVGDRHAALTRPNVAIGTPAYMSPEQAAGRPADALTDVYAVGGLLYEMLTAQAPCAGEDAMEVLRRKANEDPPPIGSLRPGLPRYVEHLVMGALARMPEDRHPSMSALKEAVLACLSAVGGTASAIRTPPPMPLHPTEVRRVSTARVRRGRIARGAVAGTLAAAAVAAAGLYLSFDRPGGDIAVSPAPPFPAAHAAVPEISPLPPAPAEPTSWPEPAAAAAASPNAPAASKRPASRAVTPAATAALPATARAPAARRTSGEPDGEPVVKVRAAHAEASPGGAASVIARGQAAFDRADYPEAVRRGREAITAGDALGGRLLIGDAYYRLERFSDALREYQAALVLDPANASIRRRRDLAERATTPH
jgi:serine/threonine protein kinase